MADFNKGWFLAYKIILVLYVIALIWYAFKNISWNNITSHFFILILDPLLIAAVMALQFIAMHKRDIKKAKISLICFGLYAAYILGSIIYNILGNFTTSSKFSAVSLELISLAIMGAITFGSFQVYKALKPSSSNGDLIKGILSV